MSIKDQVYPRSVVVRQITDVLAKELGPVIERSTRTCINCLHFDEPNEICKKYDNQRPPARIIALGCDGHEDEIPF